MVNETMYDELDRYISDRMDASERTAFEAKLSGDSSLKEELNWLQSTLIAMQTNGRLVIKQHIGAAIASVPKSDLQKYSPSKNKKPFWKKWWVIAVAAVAVAVTVSAVYYATHKHDMHDERDSEGGVPSEATVIPAVNMDSLMQLKIADSCAAIDSAMKAMETDPPRQETVRVDHRETPKIYYEVDPPLDKVKLVNIIDGRRGFDDGNFFMTVSLNVRQSPPYTYTLDSTRLVLNSNYRSSKKLRFSGSGDTVIMTDSLNNSYRLLRNKGKLPLVKMQGASK